ncbi:type II toxin-antitoxin system death-on-curing family toxin [Microbacterium enclense]|uniref:type II toxin-antitoxin system death-on-curing family toxin n=1 Tax=Microbacterium enclense TaxID=993073 RepID=UPI003F7F9D27
MSDIRYVDYELVVAANAEHCGPGAGVRDENGIRAALGRPAASMFGVDKYPTVVDKAAALLHGLSSTQYFYDGNKRTAWLVAKLFLALNDHHLRDLHDVQAEAFVLSIATKAFENEDEPDRGVEKAAEWYASQRLSMADRRRFAFLAIDVHPLGEGMFTPRGAMISGTFLRRTPDYHPLAIVMQIGWYPTDEGKRVSVRVHLDAENDCAEIAEPDDWSRAALATGNLDIFEIAPEHFKNELHADVEAEYITGHHHHGAGSIRPFTQVFLTMLRLHGAGTAWVCVEIDGEDFARLPFTINDAGSVDGERVLPALN